MNVSAQIFTTSAFEGHILIQTVNNISLNNFLTSGDTRGKHNLTIFFSS